MGRVYYCTSCDSVVRAEAVETSGGFPNGFVLACGCTSLDSAPHEMTQADIPSSWRIRRPSCCRDADVKNLDRVYDQSVSDYECPDCGAKYRWDGSMSEFPSSLEDADAIRPEGQSELTDVNQDSVQS